ncbi:MULTISPECIES: hypothetical protein [unclassified Cupriavidus]|uniref:hypothetical protein n=1 Tax=unclassified Cupriavidus TaxID=2640874 RepID=UPI00313BC5D8
MTTAVEEGGSSDTQRDRAWRELLQLHRSAVMQADPDLSDLFEQRLAKFRESLLSEAAEPSLLTKDAVLDFAAMHGIISSRRHKSEWSEKFNTSLVGFAASIAAALARGGIDPALAKDARSAEPYEASLTGGPTGDERETLSNDQIDAIHDIAAETLAHRHGYHVQDARLDTRAVRTWRLAFARAVLQASFVQQRAQTAPATGDKAAPPRVFAAWALMCDSEFINVNVAHEGDDPDHQLKKFLRGGTRSVKEAKRQGYYIEPAIITIAAHALMEVSAIPHREEAP